MKNLNLSLIDNDYVLRAKTNLNSKDNNNGAFKRFLRSVEERLVTGETAYLEIEGLHKDPTTFVISRFE